MIIISFNSNKTIKYRKKSKLVFPLKSSISLNFKFENVSD